MHIGTKMAQMYNSVLDTAVTGAIGVGSVALVTSGGASDAVQIAQIISGFMIAIAHIVFGYLIYKEQKNKVK